MIFWQKDPLSVLSVFLQKETLLVGCVSAFCRKAKFLFRSTTNLGKVLGLILGREICLLNWHPGIDFSKSQRKARSDCIPPYNRPPHFPVAQRTPLRKVYGFSNVSFGLAKLPSPFASSIVRQIYKAKWKQMQHFTYYLHVRSCGTSPNHLKKWDERVGWIRSRPNTRPNLRKSVRLSMIPNTTRNARRSTRQPISSNARLSTTPNMNSNARPGKREKNTVDTMIFRHPVSKWQISKYLDISTGLIKRTWSKVAVKHWIVIA